GAVAAAGGGRPRGRGIGPLFRGVVIERPVAAAAIEIVGRVVVGDVEVGQAVAVEIERDRADGAAALDADSGRGRRVRPGPVGVLDVKGGARRVVFVGELLIRQGTLRLLRE